MAYELWDPRSGNRVGRYGRLAGALADVADAARRLGRQSPEVLSLGLFRTHGDPRQALVAEGEALVQRALGAGAAVSSRRPAA